MASRYPTTLVEIQLVEIGAILYRAMKHLPSHYYSHNSMPGSPHHQVQQKESGRTRRPEPRNRPACSSLPSLGRPSGSDAHRATTSDHQWASRNTHQTVVAYKLNLPLSPLASPTSDTSSTFNKHLVAWFELRTLTSICDRVTIWTKSRSPRTLSLPNVYVDT